jgi:hypothetical protein
LQDYLFDIKIDPLSPAHTGLIQDSLNESSQRSILDSRPRNYIFGKIFSDTPKGTVDQA